jgi:hypothetical protein
VLSELLGEALPLLLYRAPALPAGARAASGDALTVPQLSALQWRYGGAASDEAGGAAVLKATGWGAGAAFGMAAASVAAHLCAWAPGAGTEPDGGRGPALTAPGSMQVAPALAPAAAAAGGALGAGALDGWEPGMGMWGRGLLVAMEREHSGVSAERYFDARPWAADGPASQTRARDEWLFVTSPEDSWPAPLARGRAIEPPRSLLRREEAARAGLCTEELIALRLASGPMATLYNAALRAGAGAPPAALGRNRFPATLAALVSALAKLARAPPPAAAALRGRARRGSVRGSFRDSFRGGLAGEDAPAVTVDAGPRPAPVLYLAVAGALLPDALVSRQPPRRGTAEWSRSAAPAARGAVDLGLLVATERVDLAVPGPARPAPARAPPLRVPQAASRKLQATSHKPRTPRPDGARRA